MKLKPLGDRVIVRPQEGESKTKSGIIIPDTAKEKSQKGKILATGEGKYQDGKLVPVAVKVGDVILFEEYGGEEIKLDGEELIIVKEEKIIGIIES